MGKVANRFFTPNPKPSCTTMQKGGIAIGIVGIVAALAIFTSCILFRHQLGQAIMGHSINPNLPQDLFNQAEALSIMTGTIFAGLLAWGGVKLGQHYYEKGTQTAWKNARSTRTPWKNNDPERIE